MLISGTVDMLIGGVGFFVGGFAVGFIVAKLRNWHETEEYAVGYWYTIHAQDDRIDALEEEKQELRDRLAAEIWRNRRRTPLPSYHPSPYESVQESEVQYEARLDQAARYMPDDETLWRVGEVERQIRAWEKL